MTQANLDFQRIATAIEYLTVNFKNQPNLDEVARQVHLSPHHFQRKFTDWAGVSPKKFIQFLSLDYLRERIFDTSNLHQAADLVGYSAQSRVYDLFVTLEAVTPREYKTMGVGLDIRYGYHSTPFGECLIAVTDRGICALSFVDPSAKQVELERLAQKWALANLSHHQEETGEVVQKIFSQNGAEKIQLLVQGTNFQIKVWEALLNIPAGSLSTYAKIARSINHEKAVRAVGTAIGKNPIAYLIPCHRVIRKGGQIGQYHWGSTRKKAIIGWEMAH